jgi:ribA/ribD-fused uncharacterized protein
MGWAENPCPARRPWAAERGHPLRQNNKNEPLRFMPENFGKGPNFDHAEVFKKELWKKIATHNETEIRGFFGEFRFLSNFWPAKVFLDGEEYGSVENAYQAAKYRKEYRDFFKKCAAKEIKKYVEENNEGKYPEEEWEAMRDGVMKDLLSQKFDQDLNPEIYGKLAATTNKYLEETNYWGDTYWGVNKSDASEEGIGENNLGKLLMEIRGNVENE